MANIFATRTRTTPEKTQQSVDVYEGIGNKGERRDFAMPRHVTTHGDVANIRVTDRDR